MSQATDHQQFLAQFNNIGQWFGVRRADPRPTRINHRRTVPTFSPSGGNRRINGRPER